MATLKLPTVEYPGAASDRHESAENEFNSPPQPAPSSKPAASGVALDGPMRAALASLLEGLDYAHDLQTTPWDFAVELACLRRLKLSNNDLRWLHARGLIEHAVEVDNTGAAGRAFRRRERVVFGKRSCFVLTPAGASLAREVHGRAQLHEPRIDFSVVESATRQCEVSTVPPAPHWDRNRHELRIGQVIVKRFTVPSFEQESVLAAFEEQSWPSRIDDPLQDIHGVAGQVQLPETVRRLNVGHRRPLIQFQCDGSHSVVWQFSETQLAALAEPLPAGAHA